MKITVKELTTVGPTIHSSFSDLPFIRVSKKGNLLTKPILAYQTPSCIKIVGNIHQFTAMQDLGKHTIPVYLIEESENTLDLIQVIIQYYDPMTLMDKALLTKAALELGVPRPMLAEQIFPSLEIAPREKLIDQVLFLLKLPSELKTFIVDKDLSLKRALIFKRAEHHLDWVSRLMTNLKIGINMTAEIIQNVWEMAHRDDVDFKTKAEALGLWGMADTVYEDNRLAVIQIRSALNAARFPLLTQAGENLQSMLDSSDLPESVKVKWDPQFEQQGLDIRFHAKDESELDDVLDNLSKASFKKLFKHI